MKLPGTESMWRTASKGRGDAAFASSPAWDAQGPLEFVLVKEYW
jgi:hypothetical protein